MISFAEKSSKTGIGGNLPLKLEESLVSARTEIIFMDIVRDNYNYRAPEPSQTPNGGQDPC